MTTFELFQYLVLGLLFWIGACVIWRHPEVFSSSPKLERRSLWPTRWLKKNRQYRRKTD